MEIKKLSSIIRDYKKYSLDERIEAANRLKVMVNNPK